MSRRPAPDAHDHGLVHDLRTLAARATRRDLLRWMAGASLIPLVGCTTDDAGTGVDAGGTGTDGGGTGTCAVIPEETAGPYPGDGSNGANALALSGIVRSDITSSFAGATGVAAGIPLTITLTLVDTGAGCAPLVGYAVYLWHCDQAGRYSMYSSGVTGENYLRGVQVSDGSGQVTFTSIVPGCYAGRWPHIHFEVFPSVSTSAAGKVKTSQLALPKATCEAVYATSGYSASVANLANISLASDNVFSDGSTLQLASVAGSTTAGYTAMLTVGVNG